MEDLLLAKAQAFTDTEDECLAVWLEAALGGQFASASQILKTGLLAEHYRSLLHEDEGQITPDQRATLSRLNDTFHAAVRKFRERPAPPQRREERGKPEVR